MPKWCAEGLTSVGDVYLKGISLPTFYLGLYKNAAEPAADDEMTAITEVAVPGEDGYARIALDPGDWAESPAGVWKHAAQAFLADGGDWGLVTGFFVTTEETGTAGDLVCVKHFPQGPYQISDKAGMAFKPIVTNVTEFSPSQAYIGNIQVILIPAADYSFPELGDYDWLLVDYADRLYPWPEYCGIPGGIPERTTIYTTLGVAGQAPSYAQSVTAAQINTAIANCPSGQVVYLYPGTYNIGNVSFSRKNGVTLRGARPGQTILRPTGSGNFIESGYPDFSSSGALIASGYTKGSMAITLSSAPSTYFRAGNLMIIAETNDHNKWATDIGIYMSTSVSGGYPWNLATEQLKFCWTVRIESVVGNTINLAAPIPLDFKAGNTPRAYAQTSTAPPCSMCGIEEMTIDGVNASSYSTVNWRNADRMWMKNIEIKNCAGGDNGILFSNGTFQCEWNRVYIHDCQGFPTQSDGQGIGLEWATSNALVVDCIAYRLASLIQGAGCVAESVLYNYTSDMSRDGYVSNNWVNAAIAFHGPTPYMGLYEGNVISRFLHDGYHGNAAWQIVYRNHVNGLSGTLGCIGERKLMHLLRGGYYMSVLGNVLGDASWTLNEYDAGPGSGDNVAYGLGYPSVWNWGLTAPTSWPDYTKALPDADVLATLLRHANYDYYHHAVVWTGSLGHDLPASLFYASKPSWFGSLQWPPIGPDVGGLITDIPAQRRWKTYLVSGNLDDLFTDVS